MSGLWPTFLRRMWAVDPFYGWRTQDADGLLALLVDDWFGDLQYMGLHGIIYIIIYTYYPI